MMTYPKLVEVPPDPDSPFLSVRHGQRCLRIRTAGDLIDALMPFRDRDLFVDAGLDDVGIVGDIVLDDSGTQLLLDVISQDNADG